MTSVSRGRVIGITGGFGCGKSEVGRILARHGVPVLDADDVARDQLQPGSPVLQQVVQRFGQDLVGPDGRLDRRALGRRVFARPDEREALNALVHPPVMKQMRRWVADERTRHAAVAVIIPLLYEVGSENEWDAVICVAAAVEVTTERLMKKGWSKAEIRERMAAQMPLEQKMQRATRVVRNDGSLEELERAVMSVWSELAKKE